MELDFQVHIRSDGTDFRAFFYDRIKNEWSDAPQIDEATMTNVDLASAYAQQLLKHVRNLKGTLSRCGSSHCR